MSSNSIQGQFIKLEHQEDVFSPTVMTEVMETEEEGDKVEKQIFSRVQSHNASDDTDDPVVKEFPIFITSQLASKIHIFQYPVRPSTLPYANTNGEGILDFRLKPDSGLVEVDVPINTTRFYDKEKSEKWELVDRQTLNGILSESSGYMIGIFKDNELHLTPIAGTCQLRPGLAHVDKDSKTEKDIAKSIKQDPTKAKEVRAVQMSAKSTDDLSPRYSGAISARRRAEDERFTEMGWFDKDTEQAWELADQLLCSNKQLLLSITSKEEYIDKLKE
ncbi:Sin-like protein conserved region-domain-containing protein [Dipodascopsis uninucleata]